MELLIDPEFSGLQRKLTPEEFDQLEENILADSGVIDPIVIWKGHNIIIDGENRYTIAKKHKGVTFIVEEKDFSSRAEVMQWIIKHQLGRRNLEGVAAALLRARVLNETKDVSAVAEMFGVTERTVFRDASSAKAVEKMPEDIQDRLSKGALVASTRALKKLDELGEVQKEKVYHDLRTNLKRDCMRR